jgi:dipeptidyl aminopeptidase/acylaminoacyl peptidase
MRTTTIAVAIGVLAIASIAIADEPSQLETTPLAKAFGSAPAIWNLRLSPDGSKMVALQVVPTGTTIARVFDFMTGAIGVVLAGKEHEFDVEWCDWDNDTRLLCGIAGVTERAPGLFVRWTRLVGVNADGTQMKTLLEKHIKDDFTQFQDHVVDWLPDDPSHVLVQQPTQTGSGIARLDINSDEMLTEIVPKDRTYAWISDGYGTPRLYQSVNQEETTWYARATPDAPWKLLHTTKVGDKDGFSPIGFGESRNELLYFDRQDGRTALFGLDLEHDNKSRLIYSNPSYDVAGVQSLGKHRRLVAVAYADDRTHLHFFDARIGQIRQAIAEHFKGEGVSVIDEDWSQRYYLIFVSSDTDPGSYYRLDYQTLSLKPITHAFPSLNNRELAPMRPVTYMSGDGASIPAYLTLPAKHDAGPLPAVILPHGGPSARDYWAYDFLVQYLVANGYVVLQSNYRGSSGYGAEWLGEGGFHDWRRAIADVNAGAEYLVREHIADPRRICTVGWSYGGYAALMSAIEQPKTYRCVVSIAGVTDPAALARNAGNFVGGAQVGEFVGATDPEVRKAGSPDVRAAEIAAPVLLIHAEHDLNVPFKQSSEFAKTLKKAHKDVTFIEYQYAQHDIRPERYRIDLLARVGAFLEKNIGH